MVVEGVNLLVHWLQRMFIEWYKKVIEDVYRVVCCC